jgi:hypothetical protein
VRADAIQGVHAVPLAAVEAGNWTWLEIVKLGVAALTPIAVTLLGLWIARAVRRIEQAQWTNRKLIERRLDVFDRMAEPLNDLFCFFRRVGHFQEITPPDTVARKRQLDRLFFVNEALMTDEFVAAYHAFMGACFQTFVGAGLDAQLKASLKAQRAERREGWRDEWTMCFVESESLITGLDVVKARYQALVDSFSEDLGVTRKGVGTSELAQQGRRREEPQ